MPRIRPSVKRMHYETWKDWQKEAYLGVHTSFSTEPVMDARGYQYRPIPVPVYATIKPYSAFDKPVPQVEFWIDKAKEPKRTLGQRLREWLNK